MGARNISKTVGAIKKNPFWGSLFKNSAWAFIGDSGASVINLIVSIILIHFIGDSRYGVLLLGQAYMFIMDTLLNVQSWKGVIQYGQESIVNKKINEFHGYVKLGFLLDISTALLGGVAAVFAVGIIGRIFGWSSELLMCAQISSFTIFSNISGTATAVLRLLNKFNWVALQKISSALIKLGALLFMFCAHPGMPLWNVAVIYVASDIVGNLLLVIFAALNYQKKYGITGIIKSKIPKKAKSFIRFTLWGTVSEIVDIPVNYLDGFIVSLLGDKYVAILKVFRQLVNIIQKAMAPIQQSILPQFSELSASNRRRDGFNVVKKIHRAVIKIGIPLAIIFGISSPLWLRLVYGPQYAEHWLVFFMYLVIQTVALSYTSIHPYFLSLGKAKLSAFYIAIANVSYLLVSFIFVNTIGLIGVPIAFFLQCSLAVGLKYKKIKKELKIIRDKDLIIIGADHYNTLGIVRLAGEAGYRPTLILTSDEKINPTAHSKYLKKVIKVPSLLGQETMDALASVKSGTEKIVIIPTGDPAAMFLDEQYDVLKESFVLPNIRNRRGAITELMSKITQYNMCTKCNVNMAKTWLVSKKTVRSDEDEFPSKVIIKPNISALGEKADIKVANNRKEAKRTLSDLFDKGYEEVIVQEYIDFDKEQSLMGISYGGEVIVPGVVNKLTLTPSKAGTSSYGEIIPTSEYPYDIAPLISYVKNLGYDGLFEIEFFVKEGSVFFNELNLRNSANVYAFMGDGVNYLDIYLSLIYKSYSVKEYVSRKFSYCQDSLHLKNIKEKAVSPLPAVTHIAKSTKLVYNRNDMKPFMYKFYKKLRIVKHD